LVQCSALLSPNRTEGIRQWPRAVVSVPLSRVGTWPSEC
jgi:hypothetical protein